MMASSNVADPLVREERAGVAHHGVSGTSPASGTSGRARCRGGGRHQQPVDTTEAFASDVGEVYAWMRVTGAEGRTIQVLWTHGAESVPVSLEIGGSSWRTWSSKTVWPEDAGDWAVEVRDADGNVLATASFTVGEAGAISSSGRRRG